MVRPFSASAFAMTSLRKANCSVMRLALEGLQLLGRVLQLLGEALLARPRRPQILVEVEPGLTASTRRRRKKVSFGVRFQSPKRCMRSTEAFTASRMSSGVQSMARSTPRNRGRT